MELPKYLLCIATRHEKAKDDHEEELKAIRLWGKKSKIGRQNNMLTHKDEIALLKDVIGSVRGKPDSLKKLSLHAIVGLSYILMAKMENNPFVEGHEIIRKLVCDPERTMDYLNGFTELKEQGWIRFTETPGVPFTDQPPFCWLQSNIELGDTFDKEMGVDPEHSRSFTSNDAYLDAVFSYLQTMLNDYRGNVYKVNDPDADLSTLEPPNWFTRIATRVNASTCELPAAEAREKYSLSVYQHLALIGLLGTRDGDLSYDFSTPINVTFLFAQGRVCRKRMQEHLYGEKSRLMKQKLVQACQGAFGETVRMSQAGTMALLGSYSGKCTVQELKSRIRKNTLFDLMEAKVKKESLLLPESVMEAIRTLIFSESRKGRQIRRRWHESLPSAWGSPTGSTVLLYGPPGTGKTLTAQYLASELKLPLLKIDAAKVLSPWVGESEQNVRRLFDDYSVLQKELGTAPLLLINEADQLLGARGSGVNAVDRMNNNMQNLFLEGLEGFSGLLVATTNRRDLLDEAFGRRFTYKLELPLPDKELRVKLWKSHLPQKRLAKDLNLEKLAHLSLTGGEIRLVIERVVRLQAYRGIDTIDQATLTEIAQEELLSRLNRSCDIPRIGFYAETSK